MSNIVGIVIAQTEPDWVKNLSFGGASKMIDKTPDAHDFSILMDDGCQLIIERKTPGDFLNGIKPEDNRTFTQVARMSEMRMAQHRVDEQLTVFPYMLITGQFFPNGNGKVVADGRETGWGYAAVQGTILSIQEAGVFVTFCNGDLDLENAILRISKRDRKPAMRILPARPMQLLGPKAAVLCSLPGIGLENMQSILDWSNNNLGHALIGLTDLEIKSPVGLALRRRLRDVLGLCEGENLEIVGTQILEPITEGDKANGNRNS